MLHLLPEPLPWYIVGPLLGLIVAAMYALTNNHLGVSGSYVQFVDFARGRSIEAWRLWFIGGFIVSAALVAILGTSPQTGLDYGHLGKILPLGPLVAVLFVGGTFVGFGARWLGGCTSGHGITGCSTRSPGSMAAMVTFMVAAVGATFILHVLTGGAL